jgi:hypothetical protein
MDVFLYILSAICLLMLATILRHLLTVRRRLVTRIDVFRCRCASPLCWTQLSGLSVADQDSFGVAAVDPPFHLRGQAPGHLKAREAAQPERQRRLGPQIRSHKGGKSG